MRRNDTHPPFRGAYATRSWRAFVPHPGAPPGKPLVSQLLRAVSQAGAGMGLKLEVPSARGFREPRTATGSIRSPDAKRTLREFMPYLLKVRRALSGPAPREMELERATARPAVRWHGLIPDADLSLFSLASLTHRLAQFGIDPDAEPLLERRKRGF